MSPTPGRRTWMARPPPMPGPDPGLDAAPNRRSVDRRRRARRTYAGLRALPSRRGGGGDDVPPGARRGRARTRWSRRRLPGRLSAAKSVVSWNGRCWPAICSAWPRPTRWNSGSIWSVSTPSCSPAIPARSPRCGSRPVAPAVVPATRCASSSPGTTRWTPILCIIPRRSSAGRSRRLCSIPRTRTSSGLTSAARPRRCR